MTATLPRPSSVPPAPPAPPPGRTRRRRPGARPVARWQRPATAALLLGTALLHLVGLGASGWANSYYAAAVQAGTQSWKAFLFGSLDAGNAITVDKPPASLWLMELSARLFGFSSWSMLVPQALLGVGAVWLLTATVRRWAGAAAGLIAGVVLALTPVAVLMFRYNQPDALLVFLLVAAAYAVTRAVEHAACSGRWMLLAGTAMGCAFLTKSLQAFTVLPALLAVFLLAAPLPWRQRVRDLAVATVALVVSGGWWFTLVSLWPAASRPYIGGSTTNSAWELAFGYNGLGRVTGGDSNGASFSGTAGILRLFNAEMGGQISWLLPAALLLGVAAAVRGDRRTRAAVVLFGGWLVVTGALLSFMSGTVHPYYTVELAPAIAALVGIGLTTLWRQRRATGVRVVLAATLAVTAAWSWVLLRRSEDFLPWLAWTVLIAGFAGAASVLALGRARHAVAAVLALAMIGGLGGASAYAVQTAATAHTGSMATAGPSVAGGTSGGPGGSGGPAGLSAGGPGGSGRQPTGTPPATSSSTSSSPMATTTRDGGGGGTGVSSALAELLEATTTRWAAATNGAQGAASLELATGTSVIGIGGFTGSDDAPTLAQFERWVADGEIGYYVVTGDGGAGGGADSGAASQIAAWVEAHYTATTVGSATVYDLTATAD